MCFYSDKVIGHLEDSPCRGRERQAEQPLSWGLSGQIGHVATLYRFGSLSMPLLPCVVLGKLLLPSFPG